MIGFVKRLFRRFRRGEKGNVTIEFVIIFPAFIVLFLSAFEAGILMTRWVMLERALDLSVRGLRLGAWSPPTHQELKDQICTDAAIIPDCDNSLLLELRPVSTETWQPLGTQATCIDRDSEIEPVVAFSGGNDNEMMLVRACAVFDPVFPSTGLGLRLPKDATGAYALISSSAFVNEPS